MKKIVFACAAVMMASSLVAAEGAAELKAEIARLKAQYEAEKKPLGIADEAGVYVCATPQGRQIFVTGHPEYDANTLRDEYFRDKNLGLPIDVPKNYFPDDDDTKEPPVTWRSAANLLYYNWLNYFVYQTTPYDINDIK